MHAFLVAATGATPDMERLRALVGSTLGPAAVPNTIRLIDRVPVTPGGKPDKAALPG